MLVARRMVSPVGALTLVARGDALAAILWADDAPGRVPLDALTEDSDNALLIEAETQLDAYFAGERRTFDLPMIAQGTAFQRAVWDALRAIPYGETRSYSAIACAIGRSAAVRAVGAANARNPLSIVVPCHRVVGSGGSLTGFAGGLAAKRHLIDLERRVSGRSAADQDMPLFAERQSPILA